MNLKIENLVPFLKVATILQVNENAFIYCLKDLLNKKNIFFLLEVFKILSAKHFSKYLMSIIEYNFVTLSKTDEFKLVDYKVLKSIISSSELNVSSEIEVFEAVVRWVDHDEKFRAAAMCELLKMVRLPLLSRQALENVVRNNKFCRSCPACCDHIETVLASKEKRVGNAFEKNRACMNDFTAFFQDEAYLVTLETKPGFDVVCENQHPLEFKNFVHFADSNKEVNLLSIETLQMRTLQPFVEIPRYKYGGDTLESFASSLFMEKLYVTGGWLQTMDDDSDAFHVYMPETKEWRELRGMGTARVDHSCVAFAGKIVVTGGTGTTGHSVEAYDIFAGEWTYMPDLTEEKFCHGSVAMGNKLFVVACIDTQNCEVFDCNSDKFTLIKPFPLKCDFDHGKLEYFRVRNEIIVKYDGKEADHNVFIYNTIEDKWSSKCVQLFKEYSYKLLYA